MTVIDASVYVALVFPGDSRHVQVREWYERSLKSAEALTAPAIILSEVGAALGRSLGRRSLGLRVVQRLESSKAIVLHPVTVAMASRAASVAIEQGLRGCDAIYVALAEQLGEPLVTLDEEQLARGGTVVATLRPE